MGQSASADAPESFASRPDIPSVSDVLSTVLRTVRLSGQEVTEVVAEPPTEWTQPDDVGAVHLVESGDWSGTHVRVTGSHLWRVALLRDRVFVR